MREQSLDAIVRDEWLSRVLGKKAYRIVPENFSVEGFLSPGSDAYRQFESLAKEPVFIYAKVPSTQSVVLNRLQSLGFSLVEKSFVMHKIPAPFLVASESIHIRQALPGDEATIYAIAQGSFSFSRFHMDSAIENTLADKIKAEWTRSYFRGQRGNTMLVAVYNGHIAGFVLLIDKMDDTVVIDLMAVESAYRRKNIATALVAASERLYQKKRFITVSTQKVNNPSVRLYAQKGFRLSQSLNVLHCHGPDSG